MNEWNPFEAPPTPPNRTATLCPVCHQKLSCTFIWRFSTTFRFRCVQCRSKLLAYSPELVFVGIASLVGEFGLLWALQYFGAQMFGFSYLTGMGAGGLGGLMISLMEQWFARYVLAFAIISPAKAQQTAEAQGWIGE